MNLAIGFCCPECGHDTANILELVMDEFHVLTGHRLQCTRCETVYMETRDSTGEEELDLELVFDDAIGRS
jgi:rubredoxin